MPKNDPNGSGGPVDPTQAAVWISDRGIEIADGTNVRAQLGDISANNDGSSYGLKIISADGATVIIDGTSEVFRIQASGTTSATAPAGNQTLVMTTLGGLGTFTAVPASQNFVSDGTGATSIKVPAGIAPWTWNSAKRFVATTSGGSPTEGILIWYDAIELYTVLNGSNQCQVWIETMAQGDSVAFTGYGKYYVLIQAAM